MVKKIKKRDGRISTFNPQKIHQAIKRCADEANIQIDIKSLTDYIVLVINDEYGGKRPHVEDIQDIVESVLMHKGHHELAKKYILYRQQRTEEREKNTYLMQTVGGIFDLSSEENDTKRDNANTNTDTPMGTMLKVGSETSKDFYLKNVLKKEYADAYLSGQIHIHDLDFYNLTSTCIDGSTRVFIKKDGMVQSVRADSFDSLLETVDSPHYFDDNTEIFSKGSWVKLVNVVKHHSSSEQVINFKGKAINLTVTSDHVIPTVDTNYKTRDTFASNITKDDRFKILDIPKESNYLIDKIDLIDTIKDMGEISDKAAIANREEISKQIQSKITMKKFFEILTDKNFDSYDIDYPKTRLLYNGETAITVRELCKLEALIGRFDRSKLIVNVKGAKRNYGIPAILPLTYDLGYIVGLMLSDGSVIEANTSRDGEVLKAAFTNADLETIGIFNNKMNTTFPFMSLHDRNSEVCSGGTNIGSLIFCHLFSGILAYKRSSADMCLPEFVYSATNEYISGLLTGIVDGDSSVSKELVRLSSASCKFMEQISLLLTLRGVPNTLKSRNYANTKYNINGKVGVRNYNSYSINICSKFDVLKTLVKSEKIAHLIDTHHRKDIACYSDKAVTTNHTEYVYDFETENHYFSANGVTVHNCTQIDLEKLLKNGFSTGNGSIRPPKSIRAATSLVAIVLQSNQNDQHGGQSIPNFDFDLAPYVEISYQKYLKDNTNKYCISSGKPKRLLLDEDIKIIEAMSWEDTKEETYQAMEALIHNLNTMSSRAGAQVPFSSINIGMDTSKEGRLVTECLLKAQKAGLGNGDTPTFPILVYKVKDGVNGNPDDPNYDLFRLACECAAQRLFPCFAFLDAPFNMQYYKAEDKHTHASYMGCVQGDEVITYKINDTLYVESIKRAYNRINKIAAEEKYGKSNYINGENLDILIYDTNSNGFVKCKKFIKNPNLNNWKRLRLSNGRALLATKDHPLPVYGKGRTKVDDIIIGDIIPITYEQYHETSELINEDYAWMLGLLLCDASYSGSIVFSLGYDESDIVDKLRDVVDSFGLNICVTKQDRGVKGLYQDIRLNCGDKLKKFKTDLSELFGGTTKKDRQIPNEIFRASRSAKLAFLSGMMDADGYVAVQHGHCRMNLGSTNKELALQQMALVQSLGYPCKLYMNRYNGESENIRYKLEFTYIKEMYDYMASVKKKSRITKFGGNTSELKAPKYAEVIEIIDNVCVEECSYDVETESDMFDVSGILSHNCRTRVLGNAYDSTKEIVSGRGNLSFTSINLPMLALESKNVDTFFTKLKETINLCCNQLYDRYLIQRKRKIYNHPFLYGQGVWLDSDTRNDDWNNEIGDAIRHGSLSVGFVGLAECLSALIGSHHGESDEAQELGLKIISYMRDLLDEKAQKEKLNYTLLATPAESYAGRALQLTRKKFGIIKNITDKEYFTNSFHIPPKHQIKIFEKIDKEAPYHQYCNAGHITFIELDGAATKNIEGFMSIIQYMKKSGIGYGAINVPLDKCGSCDCREVIEDECPSCGKKESDGNKIYRIRRITGYVSGTLDRWNNSKKAEEKDRVKHGL